MNFDKIPTELKGYPQWVLWKLQRINGKDKKVPHTIHDKSASTTNPDHWTSFQSAYDAYAATNGRYSGLGFVFTKDDPFTGVDLDHCVIDGKTITSQAKEWLVQLNSYTERSQSGTGVHAIVRAKLPAKGCRRDDLGIEIYQDGRFFVMTGNHVKNTPETIEERQEVINTLWNEVGKKSASAPPKITTSLSADDLIIDRAMRASNGEKFRRLFDGDTSMNNGDDSAADLALCNLLAFYSKDPEQIDRIYRMSGLMRDKWEREDYRERTINAALSTVTAQHTGANRVTSYNENGECIEDEQNDFLVDMPAEWDGKIGEAALYGLAGDVVRLVEPHTEADPVALLINFLTLFGNCIGTTPHFYVSNGEHRMKLFAVLVGATFKGKKGTSLEPILKLMCAADPELSKRKRSGLSSGEGLIYAVRDQTIAIQPVMEGKGKDRKPTGEYEEVITDYGVDDKRLLVIESEFGGVLNVLRRDGNTLSAIIRNAWDGSGDINTLTKNPMSATNTHISILGHITPEELKKLLTGNEIHNGFVNRFLWLYVQQSKSLPSGGEFHKVDVGQIVARIREAIEYAQQEQHPLERDEAADRLWQLIYEPIQRDIGGIIGAATSRVIPYLMRIACIYALLDRTHIVREEHLQAALALWDYCFKSATYIFGENQMQNDPIINKIMDGLKSCNEGLSGTDIFTGVFQKNVKSSEIKAALNQLKSNGIISVTVDRSGRGRAKQIYRLNE